MSLLGTTGILVRELLDPDGNGINRVMFAWLMSFCVCVFFLAYFYFLFEQKIKIIFFVF